MRKVDDGEKKKKRKEKNDVFSGHYVIASSLPPERLRPNDDRWNAARSCQLFLIVFDDSCPSSTYIDVIYYCLGKMSKKIV